MADRGNDLPEKSVEVTGFSSTSAAREREAVIKATRMVNAAFAAQDNRSAQRHPHGFTAHPNDSDEATSSTNTPADIPSPLVTPPITANPPPVSPQSHLGMYAAAKPSRDDSDLSKRGVPHIYHDYSQTPDTPGYVRKKTGGVTQPFPEKLHEMLDTESETEAQLIVSWLPHGRAFIVRQPKVFTKDIMPKYFRQSKLTSFQRQLNLYGFRRITQGTDGGAYYHELFLRGRPALSMRMVRQKVKGTGHKQPADANTEPNFYTMPSAQYVAGAPPPPDTPMSPGMQGLHGAASLLHGIANFERLPDAPFLTRGTLGAGELVPAPPDGLGASQATYSRRAPDSRQGQPASFLREDLSPSNEEQV